MATISKNRPYHWEIQFQDLHRRRKTITLSKLELRKTYAEATIKGTLVKTRTAFNWAIRNGWLVVSPLRGVPTGSYENEDNNRDITIDEYHRLLNVCPCYDWTTIIALARIGGLRPCEVLHLKWSDVR